METLSYPGKFLLQVTKKQYTDMAKIVDNPKRFKVIELSRNELAKIGGIGICDRCNGTSNTGYYVAVLNCWFCPKCYNEWYGCATHYNVFVAFILLDDTQELELIKKCD